MRTLLSLLAALTIACDPATGPAPQAQPPAAHALPSAPAEPPEAHPREATATFVERMKLIWVDVEGEDPLDAFNSKLDRAPDENIQLFVGCSAEDWPKLVEAGLPPDLIARLQSFAPEECKPAAATAPAEPTEPAEG